MTATPTRGTAAGRTARSSRSAATGELGLGEACDDGGVEPDDGCNGICKLEFCGDQLIQPDEECDDGDGNSDTEPDACRTGCSLAFCGDGVIDSDECSSARSGARRIAVPSSLRRGGDDGVCGGV